MGDANTASLAPAVSHVHASAAEHHIEVHAVDANGGVVLDAQVNVLLDAKAKVAILAEVLSAEFVLADLKHINSFVLFQTE